MTTRTAPRSETTSTEVDLIAGEEFCMMTDIGSAELVEGKVVSITPTGGEHSLVEFFTLGRHLGNFVAEQNVGWLLGGEVGIYTRRDPDTIRGADIAFLSKERAPEGYLEVAPE